MEIKSSGRFSGAEVQGMFGDDSVTHLEQTLRSAEVELNRLEAALDAETDPDTIDELLTKISSHRKVLSMAHRKLVGKQREFTDIARGQSR